LRGIENHGPRIILRDAPSGRSQLRAPIETEKFMADAEARTIEDQTDIAGSRAMIVEGGFYDDLRPRDGGLSVNRAESPAGRPNEVITVPGALEIPGRSRIRARCGRKTTASRTSGDCARLRNRGDTLISKSSRWTHRALMRTLPLAKKIRSENGIVTVKHRPRRRGRGRARASKQGRRRARAALAMLLDQTR